MSIEYLGTKFTPEPWGKLQVSGDRKTISIRNDHDGWHRLEVDVDSDDCDFDTAMANARLIAAAPDLFNALWTLLEEVVEPLPNKYDAVTGPIVRVAQEAISKAIYGDKA